MAHSTSELRSTVNRDGVLTLSLAEIVLDDPASDEIIVRIEAAPINPSELGLLLGPADATSVRKDASDGIPQLSLDIPPARMGGMFHMPLTQRDLGDLIGSAVSLGCRSGIMCPVETGSRASDAAGAEMYAPSGRALVRFGQTYTVRRLAAGAAVGDPDSFRSR
jgi:hypothetical protein